MGDTYEHLVLKGEQAARGNDFRDAAVWFQRASELGDNIKHLTMLERVRLMKALMGEDLASVSTEIERVLTDTHMGPLTQANTWYFNAIWLWELLPCVNHVNWRATITKQAIAWLQTAAPVLHQHTSHEGDAVTAEELVTQLMESAQATV